MNRIPPTIQVVPYEQRVCPWGTTYRVHENGEPWRTKNGGRVRAWSTEESARWAIERELYDRNRQRNPPDQPETVDPYRERRGRCYELSGAYLLDHGLTDPTLRLVHGWPILQAGDSAGLRYGHAWIERLRALPVPTPEGDGFHLVEISESWDSVTDTWIPTALYRMAGRIDPEACHVYDLPDLRSHAVATGHWGPWQPNPYPADESASEER